MESRRIPIWFSMCVFLPNPYYVEGLRAKTGNDKEIQDYVLQFKEAHEVLDKLEDMINFLIPNYIAEGKKPACHINWMHRRKTPLGNACQ